MSKSSLRDILELLPEQCQEQAILDCLQGMLTSGEWENVDSFLPPICGLNGHEPFKAKAIAIAAKCAIRARNFLLAMERMDILSSLGKEENILNSRADALFQLAVQLLPDTPTPVSRLWYPLLAGKLRADTQRTVGHIGFLLARAYAKNGDTANEHNILRILQDNLDKSVFDWLEVQFLPKKRHEN